MVKKALLILLALGAASGGTTWAVGYARGKDKNKDNKKNTKPQTKPTGRSRPTPTKPEDFRKIPAKWSSSSSSITNAVPTITITAHKDPSVTWICTVRWKLPSGGMPDFSESNNKVSQINNKLINGGADANARKSFIKNCTDGKLQGEEDIVTSSSNEIILESQKKQTDNQYSLKDLEKVYSEDFSKDIVRLTTEDYKILSANDWTMNIEKLEGDKDKKITFGSTSNSWQCTVETKNTSDDLDDSWKTSFETEVIKENISETNFGSKKKFLLKNCLNNNNAIKLVGSGETALTKEKVKELLIKNKYKNPADDSPKVQA